LTALQTLELSKTQVADVAPLEGLTNLQIRR
jgi:Leucine-rich repeat (LRR) protein